MRKLVLVTTNLGDQDGWSSYSSTIAKMASQFSGSVIILTQSKSSNGVPCLPAPNLRLSNQVKVFFLGLKYIPFKSNVHILVEPYAPATVLAARLKLARPFMTLHGTYSLLSWRSPAWIARSLIRLVTNLLCTKLTTGSKHIYDLMPKIVQSKITIIPNVVDTSVYRKVSWSFDRFPDLFDQIVILTVGEVKWRKGQLELLSAFLSSNELSVNSNLVIAGDCSSSMRKRIKAMVEKSNLQNKVHLLGRIEKEELIALYSIASCTVLYAQSDMNTTHGHPMIIHEANACGCPVVITRGSTDPDSISEGRNGFWVDEGDSVKLVDTLIKLTKLNLREKENLSRDCVESSRKFSTLTVDIKLREFYGV